MAADDLREVFPVLVDTATSGGVGISKVVELDAVTTQAGMLGFSFKDSSGRAVLPTLTPEGAVAVSSDTPGTVLAANGEAAGTANDTPVLVTGATIALTAGKTYTKIQAKASCQRDALVQLIHFDGSTNNVKSQAIVGPGQFSVDLDVKEVSAPSGATGQTLHVKMANLGPASRLRANLDTVELASS